jgi:uncharacterized repeat protein (TIGR03803 family)
MAAGPGRILPVFRRAPSWNDMSAKCRGAGDSAILIESEENDMMKMKQFLQPHLRTRWYGSSIAALSMLVAAVIAMPAQSQTFNTLFSFTDHGDGAFPAVGVIRDAKGNLYGATYAGGIDNCSFGCGVVFKVDRAGNVGILYSFTGTGGDGESPDASLIEDRSGNLYGTTVFGGTAGYGTVFKVENNGKETVLYSFTGSQQDGKFPYAGLLRDAKGDLYGTNIYSGNTSCNDGGGPGCGTVYKVGKIGKETVLYRFTGVGGDGSFPLAGLVQDASGNLYGTTWGGGSGFGTVYKLDKKGKETVLYAFSGGADGGFPYYGQLVIDSQGNLYGATPYGGSSNCSGGCGVVYKVDRKGNQTVLYTFTNSNGDGANPFTGLLRDAAGNLYGVTFHGGEFNDGTLFKVDSTGAETILHTFEGTDGAEPHGAVVRDAKGNLYGTAQSGGEFDFGTVFKLTPR